LTGAALGLVTLYSVTAPGPGVAMGVAVGELAFSGWARATSVPLPNGAATAAPMSQSESRTERQVQRTTATVAPSATTRPTGRRRDVEGSALVRTNLGARRSPGNRLIQLKGVAN
jgi:hypothetical protein